MKTNIERIISGEDKVAVVGLGYVGLPLLMAFADQFDVLGFDISKDRINELNNHIDRNDTFQQSDFTNKRMRFTSDESDLSESDVFIIAVPTPITQYKTPDLRALQAATSLVGRHMKKDAIVIFESTVYPGCTEELCIPILEKTSKLLVIEDFKVGYSPERINPGDSERGIQNTVKITSGIDVESSNFVTALYALIVTAGIHQAPTIKTAEAAKIIENVQRDLNIALVNELSLIFDRLDIDTFDVIEAAGTKWNFQKYYPGLVGGHCISVDPYYLTYKAEQVGYYPEVILSGRKVNDSVIKNVSNKALQMLGSQDVQLSESRVLVMGITFKENVPDTRNSKVFDLIKHLSSYHVDVEVLDPRANRDEIPDDLDIKLIEKPKGKYHCLILAVKHEEFVQMPISHLEDMTFEDSGIIDIKGIFRNETINRTYWTL